MSSRKDLITHISTLTRDCYYLISLLNSAENIDWEGWPEGAAIMRHVKESAKLSEENDEMDELEEARMRFKKIFPERG